MGYSDCVSKLLQDEQARQIWFECDDIDRLEPLAKAINLNHPAVVRVLCDLKFDYCPCDIWGPFTKQGRFEGLRVLLERFNFLENRRDIAKGKMCDLSELIGRAIGGSNLNTYLFLLDSVKKNVDLSPKQKLLALRAAFRFACLEGGTPLLVKFIQEELPLDAREFDIPKDFVQLCTGENCEGIRVTGHLLYDALEGVDHPSIDIIQLLLDLGVRDWVCAWPTDAGYYYHTQGTFSAFAYAKEHGHEEIANLIQSYHNADLRRQKAQFAS